MTITVWLSLAGIDEYYDQRTLEVLARMKKQVIVSAAGHYRSRCATDFLVSGYRHCRDGVFQTVKQHTYRCKCMLKNKGNKGYLRASLPS